MNTKAEWIEHAVKNGATPDQAETMYNKAKIEDNIDYSPTGMANLRRWAQSLSKKVFGHRVQAEPVRRGVDYASLPDRATRRNAARKMGVIAGWRQGRRLQTPEGNHIVVYPTTE